MYRRQLNPIKQVHEPDLAGGWPVRLSVSKQHNNKVDVAWSSGRSLRNSEND